ncbi:hypothetical protein [Pinibacter aurantiacus]|uniref:DUF1795 domain-containing protein n=1 Tax=Pinibacter aurantiacus TaxID=2851599 RepID=A0A9E2SCJ8_9BACT|nr:hypothetical protein [Pinibacter aurantiacus]MBV4360593.1 hypothetical protein [Pinibacter aurantiacus]
MRIIFVFLVLLFGATACKTKYRKAADEIAAKVPEVTNINVGKDEYSLYVPDGWTTRHKYAYGIDFYYLDAPQTKDDPNTNINVITEFMQNLSLDDYLKGTIRSVQKNIPSAVILGQGDIVANGTKGVWYSYKMEPQGIKATLVSYIFPKNGIAYVVTAGTQTKDAIRYRGIFDNVAKSFKFSHESTLKSKVVANN